MIGLDEQKKPSERSSALGKKRTSLLSDDEEEILEKHKGIVENTVDDFKLPAQLIQRYVKGSRYFALLELYTHVCHVLLW
jgi:ATP-dependent RNA helicase DDX31/DBP7